MSTLVIRQGKTLRRHWKWCNPVPGSNPPLADESNPIDMTGYSARLQVRRRTSDVTLLSFTDALGGGLTINGPSGDVDLEVSDTVTAALGFSSAVWDLEVEAPDGTVTELDSGRAVLKREVTR